MEEEIKRRAKIKMKMKNKIRITKQSEFNYGNKRRQLVHGVDSVKAATAN